MKSIFILNGKDDQIGVVYRNGILAQIPKYYKSGSWFLLTDGVEDDIIVDEGTTRGKIQSGQYKRLVEISKTKHSFRHDFDSNCLEVGYTFVITVTGCVYVDDPLKFNANIESADIQNFLGNQLSYYLKMITQKYSIFDYKAIDRELKDILPVPTIYRDGFGLSYHITATLTKPSGNARELLKQHDDMAIKQRTMKVVSDIASANKDKTFEQLAWEAAARGDISEVEAKQPLDDYNVKQLQIRDEQNHKDMQADLDMVIQLRNNNLIGDDEAKLHVRALLSRSHLTTPTATTQNIEIDNLIEKKHSKKHSNIKITQHGNNSVQIGEISGGSHIFNIDSIPQTIQSQSVSGNIAESMVVAQNLTVEGGFHVGGIRNAANYDSVNIKTILYADSSAIKTHPYNCHVRFSAVAPKALVKGQHALINIYMYEELFRHLVEKDMLNNESSREANTSGFFDINEKTNVCIVLDSTQAEIGDREIELVWGGRYSKFTYDVFIPQEVELVQVLFNGRVYFNGAFITKIKFLVDIEKKNYQPIDVEVVNSLSAFISYSSKDLAKVATVIQGMKKIRPDLDVFFDRHNLRSGQDWKSSIDTEIKQRDIFFLFWSRNAFTSKEVAREWRYALEVKGLSAIEPVPLESPEFCPPPIELKEKHFNDWMLAYTAQPIEQIK